MKPGTIKRELSDSLEQIRSLLNFNWVAFHSLEYESDLLLEMDCDLGNQNINGIIQKFYIPDTVYGAITQTRHIRDNVIIDIKKWMDLGKLFNRGKPYTKDYIYTITLCHYDFYRQDSMNDAGEYYLGGKHKLIIRKYYRTLMEAEYQKSIICETLLEYSTNSMEFEKNIEYLNFLAYEWNKYMNKNGRELRHQLEYIKDKI